MSLKSGQYVFHVSSLTLREQHCNASFLIAAVNCSDPPVKPPGGTWEWNGDYVYKTSITYTCGPYGRFLSSEGTLYENLISTCAWNKTWVPNELDICAATSCQVIPFPPKSIGMVYTPDAKNNISLASEFSIYNPTLPMEMKFPGGHFCGDNQEQMMIVGTIPLESEEALEVIFATGGLDEAFHIRVDADNEVVTRWGVSQNVTQEVNGLPGEGTTVDRDEPFVLR